MLQSRLPKREEPSGVRMVLPAAEWCDWTAAALQARQFPLTRPEGAGDAQMGLSITPSKQIIVCPGTLFNPLPTRRPTP